MKVCIGILILSYPSGYSQPNTPIKWSRSKVSGLWRHQNVVCVMDILITGRYAKISWHSER